MNEHLTISGVNKDPKRSLLAKRMWIFAMEEVRVPDYSLASCANVYKLYKEMPCG
jgi:hypothetical protein